MAYEIKFARVTNAGKLPDRFLTCQQAQPQDLAKSSMGQVFSVVEILSPWFPTAQIGQLIINNFSKYYFQGGSTSDLLNFEESIKKVNESLAQATQDGETDWIGKLNGLLAVIIDNNLHVAPTGKTEAYIFRDGKINHLTDGLAGSVEVHPLKTFSNVISGELKPHDKILLTSGDLFNHLSLDSVGQVIILNNPSQGAAQLAKLLRKARAKNVNFIIINLYSQEEMSAQPAEEDLEEVYYLDKSTDTVINKLKFLWTNIISPVSKITAAFLAKTTRKTIQGTSAKIKGLKEKNPPSVLKSEAQINALPSNEPEVDRFHREFLNDGPRDDGLLKDEQIDYSPEYAHYYKEKSVTKESKLPIVFSAFKDKAKNVFKWLMMIAKDKKYRNVLYISGAIVIIIVIALFAKLNGQKTKIGNLDAQKILDEAIAAQKEGSNFLTSGNTEEAKASYSVAIQKAGEIKNNSLVAKDANNVLTASYQEIDKLTSTTRFSELAAVNSVSEKTITFHVISGDIFFIGPDQIFEGTILGADPKKVATLPSGKGEIIATSRADKIIYLYTNSQIIFSFDSATNKLEQLKVPAGKWESANSIANYIGSLYLLDGVTGQIHKHSSSQSSFGAGAPYVATNNSLIKQGVSIAIDGDVYVLTGTGGVTKIKKSKIQDFTLSGLPTPFSKIETPVKIFTDSDTPSIYILDSAKKRIIEFDKEGLFVHQYALPDKLENIKDFNVSVKSRKMWVLDENSIYELNI